MRPLPSGREGSSARAAGRFDRRRSRLPPTSSARPGPAARARLPRAGRACGCRAPYCRRLGAPFPVDWDRPLLSPAAIADPPVFQRARAVAPTRSRVSWCTASVRRPARTRPRPRGMMVRAGAEALADADVVVPVPLPPGACGSAGSARPWRWPPRTRRGPLRSLPARAGEAHGEPGRPEQGQRQDNLQSFRVPVEARSRDGPRAPRRRRPDDRLDRQCSLARAPARRAASVDVLAFASPWEL